MRILIVAATSLEVAPLVKGLQHVGERALRLDAYRHGVHDVDLLIAGIGMIATAAWCSRILARTPYELALNVGVCGSFDPVLTPGQVVHVISDRIVELGAEDGDMFLTIEQLGLSPEHECTNRTPPVNAALERMPAVCGITVNTVHGNDRTIAETTRRFAPQVESMEGAAFMYACAISAVPFAQVRAVSNVVTRRDRAAWRLAEAIDALGRAALDVLSNA